MKWVTLSALAAVLVAGCNQDDSGVITNKAPFYQQGFVLPLSEGPKIVSESRAFAKKRGMRILVSMHHLRPGEFSVTLINGDINILLDNVAKGDKAWLSAISRGDPTPEDKTLLSQYRQSVSLGAATDDRGPPLVSSTG